MPRTRTLWKIKGAEKRNLKKIINSLFEFWLFSVRSKIDLSGKTHHKTGLNQIKSIEKGAVNLADEKSDLSTKLCK